MMTDRALAHTEEELDTWLQEWSIAVNAGLTEVLILEFQDTRARHGWYWGAPIIMPHSLSPRAGNGIGIEQWRSLVATYFQPEDVERALCLMGYETGFTGDPNSKNPYSTAAGLFQFLKGTWDSVPLSVTGGTYSSGQVYDPEANVRSAAWLKNAYGWEQWSPYQRGLCH